MASPGIWISVGDLAKTLGQRALPESTDLDGKTLDFYFEDGAVIRHDFLSKDRLRWQTVVSGSRGEGSIVSNTEACRITRPQPDLYFVDFPKASESRTAVSVILDLAHGVGTAVIGTLPNGREAAKPILDRAEEGLDLSSVEAVFLRFRVGKPIEGTPDWHPKHTNLVGKRIVYRYSDSDAYRHSYLTETLYTWQCLDGTEIGLSDTDHCHHYQIRPNFYLFVWREKIIPTLGLVLIDLDAKSSSGKILGYADGSCTDRVNCPIASHIEGIEE